MKYNKNSGEIMFDKKSLNKNEIQELRTVNNELYIKLF